MKNALIAGASGLVGGELLQLMLDQPAYNKVILVLRKPLPLEHPKLVQQVVDFENISNLTTDFPVDEVFCTLGTTIRKAGSQEAFMKVDFEYVLGLSRFCKTQNIGKFMVVSAMGADHNSAIFYNRVKGEMEKAVLALNIPSIFIFRPSLLLGKRNEFRSGEKIAQLVMPAFGFLLVGRWKKYRAIHASTVAKAMIRVANSNDDLPPVLDSALISELGKYN